ncbi:MAG: hypothetical protein VKK04_06415 [Synechococcales bacterium]|nr:hypothetical protein [Synechococcales bacterium]
MTRPDQPLGARPPLNDFQRLRQPLGWPFLKPALGQSIQARLQDHPLLQPLFLPQSQSPAPSRFQLPEAFTRFTTLTPTSEVSGDRPPTPSAQQDTYQSNLIQEKATQESLVSESPSQGVPAQEVPAQEKAPERNTPRESTIQEDIIQRSTIQESPTQEETIQEETIQEETIQEETIQERTIQERTIRERTTQEETIHERTIQERTAQEEIIQERTATAQEETAQERTIQERTIREETTQEETTEEKTAQESTIQENPAEESTSQLNRREQSASVESSTVDGVEAGTQPDPGASPDISRAPDSSVPSADTIQAESDPASNEVEQGRSPLPSTLLPSESYPFDNQVLALPEADWIPEEQPPDIQSADQDMVTASVSELELESEPEPELTNFADSISLFNSSTLPDEPPAPASFATDSPVYPDPEVISSVPSVNLQPDTTPPNRPDGEASPPTALTLSDPHLSLLPDQQPPLSLESFTALPSPVSADETPDRESSNQALPDFTIAPLVTPLARVAGDQDESESSFPTPKGVPPDIDLTAGAESPSEIESHDLAIEVFESTSGDLQRKQFSPKLPETIGNVAEADTVTSTIPFSEPSGIPRQITPYLPPFVTPVLDETAGDASIDIAPKEGEGRSPQYQPSLQEASASDRRAIAATGEVQLRQSEPSVDTVIAPLPTVSDQDQQDQIYQQNQPVELPESNSPNTAPIIQAKFTPLMPSLRHPLGQWQRLQEGRVLADANPDLDTSSADEPSEASTFGVHTSHAALVTNDSAVTQNSTAASSSIVSPSSEGSTAKQPTAKQPPEAQPTEVGVSEGELGSTAADTGPIATPQNWSNIEDLLVSSALSLQPSLQEDWEQQFSLLSPTTRRSAEAPPTEAPLDGPESAMMSAKLTAQSIPNRFQPGNAADAVSSAVTLANPLDALPGGEQALGELDDETLEQLARYLYCHFRDRLVLAQERHGLPAAYPSAWLAVVPRSSLAGRSPSYPQTGPPRASPGDGEVPIPREVEGLIETICGSLADRLRYDRERHGH